MALGEADVDVRQGLGGVAGAKASVVLEAVCGVCRRGGEIGER